ncbi:HNH endonuclease [Ensifer soli]|uniref:HNH endonuclease n=1 Tax=Ciceribacter sp. sgz301302 TaxID=3342379 RepID=UPI0035B76B14
MPHKAGGSAADSANVKLSAGMKRQSTTTPQKNLLINLENHVDRTVQLGICPFCGIGSIKRAHFKEREAYDHYLPKSIYPFNSINFRNLAPACHECNSSYKLTKDPAHSGVGRRKAFYPYSESSYLIELDMTLQHCDIDELTPGDVEIQFGPAVLS